MLTAVVLLPLPFVLLGAVLGVALVALHAALLVTHLARLVAIVPVLAARHAAQRDRDHARRSLHPAAAPGARAEPHAVGRAVPVIAVGEEHLVVIVLDHLHARLHLD